MFKSVIVGLFSWSAIILIGCAERYVSPEPASIKRTVYASGELEAIDQVVLRSEISGYVVDLLVFEGDTVTKGQTLAVIANEPLKAKLDDLNQKIKAAQTKLAQKSSFREELETRVKSAELDLEREKKRYDRLKSLQQSGGASLDEIEDAQRRVAVTRERVRSTKKQMQTILDDLSFELASLTAQKDALLAELAKSSVKSPLQGKVLKRFVKQGDYVNANTSNNRLFIVGNDEKIDTVLYVDEEYAPLISVGQDVHVYSDSYPNTVFSGSIYSFEPYIDPSFRTMRVRARVNYTKKVIPGSVVEAIIIIGEKKGYKIPKSAFKNGVIRVKRNNTIIELKPQAREYNLDYMIIFDELEQNDELILP